MLYGVERATWHPQGPPTSPNRPVPLHVGGRHPTTRQRRGGHTSGVVGQGICSGTGRGWEWMGPCGCQAQGEPKHVRERERDLS
jgi:hypothetical protein